MLTRLWTFVLLAFPVSANVVTSPTSDNRVPKLAIAPSTCSAVDFYSALRCFSYVMLYDSATMLNTGKLPKFESFVTRIQDIPCSDISEMTSCLKDVPNCYDLPTLYKMSAEPGDADLYLEKFVGMQVKCNDTKEFDNYSSCKSKLSSMNQRYSTKYYDCGGMRYGDGCYAVNSTMACRWNIMKEECGDIHGMCTVDKTVLLKQGYIDSDCVDKAIDQCHKINSVGVQFSSLSIIFLIISNIFWSTV